MEATQKGTMIPTTARVEQHTDEAVNEQIRKRTEQSISYVGRQGRAQISRRLEELNHEWDIERTLEANAASIALLGLGLGAFVKPPIVHAACSSGRISTAACSARLVSARSVLSPIGFSDRARNRL